jgi:hypothetical protein
LIREVDRLKVHIKNHRNDSETKISSQAQTIRLLSSKSDLHTELTQAQHDLQLEKLLVENLRRDVETYQSMLKAEQSKCVRLKKELQDCESSKGKLEILNSLEGVPGISPTQLIEIFSEKLHSLETELATTRSKISVQSPETQPNTPSPKRSFTEEVRKILSTKQISEFLPSLSNSLLVQRILDLEIAIQERDLQIGDLTQELGEKQDPQQFDPLFGQETNFDPNSNGKLLLLSQENLAHAKDEVKKLKYQLELSQEREAAVNSHMHAIAVSTLCVNCQNKMKSPMIGETFNFSHDLPETERDDEMRSIKKENENMKSLLRERTTQVRWLEIFFSSLIAKNINGNFGCASTQCIRTTKCACNKSISSRSRFGR